MLIYVLAFVIVLAYSLYAYFTRTLDYWKKKNVKGPEPLPFFGNWKKNLYRQRNWAMAYKDFYDEFPDEKVVGVYLMTTPALLVKDLDLIKHVLIKDFDVFVDRGMVFSKSGLGNNLFHADGDTWRVLRSRISPIFTSGKLKNMMSLLINRADNFLDYLKDTVKEKSEQDLKILINKYTIESIGDCAFGMNMSTLNNEKNVFVEIGEKIFTITYLIDLIILFPNLLKNINISVFPAAVNNFFVNLVDTINKQRGGKPSNRKDFMDLMLELRTTGEIEGGKNLGNGEKRVLQITDSIMSAQAFIFFAGGYETSASTMSFMLYHLAFNQDIQDKVIAEIDDVCAKYDEVITIELLKDLSYLDQVINETLRLYPVADPIMRIADAEYRFPGTDIVVEKGQKIYVSAHAMHRDPKLYPEPDKFDPERFNQANTKERHPCAYIPFGTGPRNCIGQRFAQVQSKVLIVNLLRNFKVEPTKNTMKKMEFDPCRITLTPKGSLYVNFIPRTRL